MNKIDKNGFKYCEKAAALDHPQMGFILLRQCCGTCRVVHLLRAMDTTATSALAEAVDNSVVEAALLMLRAPCSEVARTQLTLPLRFGGCGLTRASDIASLASFTGKWAFQVSGSQLVHFPARFCADSSETLLRTLREAAELLPPQFLLPRLWLADNRLPTEVEPQLLKMEYWNEKMHQQRWERLFSQCSGRDLVRLQCQHSPSIGAWLSAIPSRALGLEISPAVYRILLRWWLDLPLLTPAAGQDAPSVCPFCEVAADSFGDHLLCYTRHQVIVRCLTAFVAAAGLRVSNEVQIAGRERPADIFVDRWTTTDPAAVDVTVTHPLAPSIGLNIRTAQRIAAAKEKQKVAKYAQLIAATQLHFIPVAITTFGTPQATEFIDDAAAFYSAKCAVDKSLCRKQLVERLQVALLHGKRLLAGIQANEGEEDWRSGTLNALSD